MFQGAGSVSRRLSRRATIALTLVYIWSQGTSGDTTTGLPTTPLQATTPPNTPASKKDAKFKTTFKNEQDDNQDLHSELNILLRELRQIAEKIEAIRKEHGQLAHGVTEISNAVKDMNERSEHIKKKVRKMSKAINKTTHHHKLKSSIKNLQKDHKRILEAMLNSTFLLRSHKSNRTALHHLHGGLKHAGKHLKNCTNTTGAQSCNASAHDTPKKGRSPSATGVVPKVSATSSSLILTTKIEGLATASPTEKNNSIPEPVVEPQDKVNPPPKSLPLPVDCTEVIQMGNMTSGVYRIKPKGLSEPVQVWCDHYTQGGGWTMLVARMPLENQQDFNLNWEDYKKGFGNPASEHWIGNEVLHAMTKKRRHELRLNITDWKDSPAWAVWKDFSVMSEDKGYTLTVGRYASGSTAGDALKWHNGMKFSTPDRDNDALMGGHCALKNNGGWWYRGYRGCYQAHPTGRFQHEPSMIPKKADKRNFDLGPVLAWQNWRGESFYPKTLFLMFRPVMP